MKKRIFVSIAAYKDDEVERTVRDLFALAAHPDRLTVAVLDQNEARRGFTKPPRGARLYVEHRHPAECKGVCWARARLEKRYNGEDYFLQLDSHHVFKPGWDELTLAEWRACKSKRAVLTAYLPPYDLLNGAPVITGRVSGPIQFSHFDHEGLAVSRSSCFDKHPEGPPIPARFFSGHFTFARGEFVERVPYDPDLYFLGEEPTMAARAYTHGFDLYHPGRTIAWHHYGRKGKRRHWDDKYTQRKTSHSWGTLQQKSIEKYRRIFCLLPHHSDRDGLGRARSLQEYEAWVGLDHYRRFVHPATVADKPPSDDISTEWALEEGFLAGAGLVVPLPLLESVESRPAKEIHLAILDGASLDAAARRVTPAEYAKLHREGWNVYVRYRTGPLRLVVWPLLENDKWGEKNEVPVGLPNLPTVRSIQLARGKKPPRRGSATPMRRTRKRSS